MEDAGDWPRASLTGGSGAEVPAFWYKQGCHGNLGAQHLPLSLGWAQGAMKMIHVFGDYMSSLCLTLKGWSLWGLG